MPSMTGVGQTCQCEVGKPHAGVGSEGATSLAKPDMSHGCRTSPAGTRHIAAENIELQLARPWFHFVLVTGVLTQWKGTRKATNLAAASEHLLCILECFWLRRSAL